jgi:hypothetical protein
LLKVLYGHNKPVSQSRAGDGEGIAKSFPVLWPEP